MMPRYTKCRLCGHKVISRNLDKHKFRVHVLPGNDRHAVVGTSQHEEAESRVVKAIKYRGERIATLGYGFGGY
jgi:hypothetical protein